MSMESIIWFTIISVAVMCLVYETTIKYEPGNQLGTDKEQMNKMVYLFLLLGITFIIKSLLAITMKGHGTDVNCFTSWSSLVYEHGFGNFYEKSSFSDYPPGYMYILYFTAAFRQIFNITADSMTGVYLIKLVPILCDLGAGFLIYKIARKSFSQISSLVLSAVYMLNPAVVINSSLWCQVDSVYTFVILLLCYFCMEKKRIAAYFVFALGVLLKPQTMIVTPVLIFTIIDQLFLCRKRNWDTILYEFAMGITAIGSFIVLSMPYGLNTVINKYLAALGSYEYATVNAYNFWAFLKLNWADQTGKFLFLQYRHWGMAAIFVAVALSALVYFMNRKNNVKYFLSAAVIFVTMFTFSVRMHERYNFPAMALILAAYILKPRKEIFYSFAALCVLHFLNVGHVLYSIVELDTTGPSNIEILGQTVDLIMICSIGILIFFGYFLYQCLSKKEPEFYIIKRTKYGRQIVKPKKTKKIYRITSSKVMEKMTKADFITLFSILAVYSVIAFFNLGATSAPQTFYEVKENAVDTEMVFDLGEPKEIGTIWSFPAAHESRKFEMQLGNDLTVPFDYITFAQFGSVYSWEEVKVTTPKEWADFKILMAEEDRKVAEGTLRHEDRKAKYEDLNLNTMNIPDKYRYIRFKSIDGEYRINEVAILDKQGNLITPVNQSEYADLFDEQELLDKEDSFYTGSYFDEIYHARTGKEMVEGARNYEWTHPPLGKFIISLGIRAFGMTPFGWRFAGTLFGVLMLPFLYLFGKRMFRKTWAAAAVTILFAFDFMHFVQTRIATIDVYGTFFIIAMYFFMFWYTQKSFYDTKLWKTFIPLFLSGICMGLGFASKWTAVYAGAGLALIFFYVLFLRWREYVYAVKKPGGKTAGISHEFVSRNFKKYFIITLCAAVVFFIIIPGLIYLLSYIPFSDGNGTGLWKRMIENQTAMFDYHADLDSKHPYSSWWYQWPTMEKPIYYHSATLLNGMKEGISAFGNPLVWWAGIPALGYMGYLIWKEHDRTALFLVVSYFAQYVPWMLVTRIIFIYHYFPCVPFVVLMIGYAMVRFVGEKKKRVYWVVGYLACAVALFVLFYPVLSGYPTSEAYIENLRLMNGWVLG